MAVTAADLAAIRERTTPLVGRAPWRAELGYGSFLTLDFGRRLPPEGPGERQRGEWHFWVQNVAWRIEEGYDPLAACEDPRPKMAAAIGRVRGRTLLVFLVRGPSLDTTLAFEGGLVLRLFPIYTEGYPNWWLFTPDGTVLAAGTGAA